MNRLIALALCLLAGAFVCYSAKDFVRHNVQAPIEASLKITK